MSCWAKRATLAMGSKEVITVSTEMLTKDEHCGALSDLADESFVSLTTFRRDGTPVSTPVWVVGHEGRLLIHSDADTWKVKRIRRDSHVRVAPCGATGKVRGEALEAEATVLSDTSLVDALETRKYGLMYQVFRLFGALSRRLRRRPPSESVTIEIVPGPAPTSRPEARATGDRVRVRRSRRVRETEALPSLA